MPPNNPGEFWIAELIRHDGNKRNVDLLRDQFRKADDDHKSTTEMEIPDDGATA